MGSSRRILFSSGSNAKGQLGISSYDDAHIFTPCQFAGCEPDQLPDNAARISQIACGANHTVLLLEHDNGTTSLWGTGDGSRGQLGPGHRNRYYGPEANVNAKTEVEVAGPDPLWTDVAGTEAGTNVFRRLILGVPTEGSLLSTSVSMPHTVSMPGAEYHTYAYTPRLVAAAWETTYTVFSRRSVAGWGSDSSDSNLISTSDSDVLLSMGSNDFGALGIGEEPDSEIQAQRGPRVVALDHVLPNSSLERRSHQSICVRSLHAGPRHVVAELVVTTPCNVADGSSLRSRPILVGWGAARHGQLGSHGGARFLARPTRLPIDVHEDPMVSCAVGNQHTVVLHASGRISALGSNKQGQIPSSLLFQSQQRIVCRVGCTWNGTYMQTTDGDGHALLSTGNNAQGQLGRSSHAVDPTSAADSVRLPTGRAISTFVCGSEHVLVAMPNSTQDTSVLGWGWNEHGNMGLGSPGNLTLPTQLWPRRDIETYNKYPQRVIGIWAGCATSWLLVE